jgi:YidC/Oxa1 family membrane protein insertase
MQSMQAIQPKVKAVQQKYKGNRQKQNEEVMKIYQEHGVNPLSGCWPMLLQLPILVTFYSVLRYPQSPPHLPAGSELRQTIDREIQGGPTPGGIRFLGVNLMCSAQQAGQPEVPLKTRSGDQVGTISCGQGIPVRIPYYVFAAAMVATTFYQQRQMQKSSPPGASQQQQMLTKIMPLMFGFWGFFFPAALVLYWTTSNLIQIGQQRLLLKAAHLEDGTPALPAPKAKSARRGIFASMMERAEGERKRRDAGNGGPQGGKPGSAKRPSPGGKAQAGPESNSGNSQAKQPPDGKPKPSGTQPPRKSSGSGGTGAGDRKKRRKR